MDTCVELERNAYYETRDAGKPVCHVCKKTDREVSLMICAARHCDNSICTGCATPLQYKLEACSEECAEEIAVQMVDREAQLRNDLYRARQIARRALRERKVA